MKIKGEISLGRKGGGFFEQTPVCIELVDREARVRFLEVHLSLADFAEVLLGHSRVKCDVELRGLNLLGKKREHKTEFVPFLSSDYMERREDAAKALAPFEVDGWEGRAADYANSHKRVNMGGVEGALVTFIRHVDKEEE